MAGQNTETKHTELKPNNFLSNTIGSLSKKIEEFQKKGLESLSLPKVHAAGKEDSNQVDIIQHEGTTGWGNTIFNGVAILAVVGTGYQIIKNPMKYYSRLGTGTSAGAGTKLLQTAKYSAESFLRFCSQQVKNYGSFLLSSGKNPVSKSIYAGGKLVGTIGAAVVGTEAVRIGIESINSAKAGMDSSTNRDRYVRNDLNKHYYELEGLKNFAKSHSSKVSYDSFSNEKGYAEKVTVLEKIYAANRIDIPTGLAEAKNYESKYKILVKGLQDNSFEFNPQIITDYLSTEKSVRKIGLLSFELGKRGIDFNTKLSQGKSNLERLSILESIAAENRVHYGNLFALDEMRTEYNQFTNYLGSNGIKGFSRIYPSEPPGFVEEGFNTAIRESVLYLLKLKKIGLNVLPSVNEVWNEATSEVGFDSRETTDYGKPTLKPADISSKIPG